MKLHILSEMTAGWVSKGLNRDGAPPPERGSMSESINERRSCFHAAPIALAIIRLSPSRSLLLPNLHLHFLLSLKCCDDKSGKLVTKN